MKYLSISVIRERYQALRNTINVPKKECVIRTKPMGDASPHIEINEIGYNYVVVERREEKIRKVTKDIDVLLYWLIESDVTDMAMEYELENRIENQDSRRLWFEKKHELMGGINERYAEKWKKEMHDILRKHPYSD
jgi:immunity protein 63 of polymorphic toxin system